ncbi:hypothetical protein G4D64_14505 [Bacillus sp. 3H-10]|uniref:Uncharacterized protein n=1 Tax=Bacillus aquiflavi TaxID=2672567 RepID=A0A6B3W5H3_9BACI|nr:hypothetical protein [Bacillus aquiflavi]NEY82684.1 hypothetical protein [Bacillus aquiflavi]
MLVRKPAGLNIEQYQLCNTQGLYCFFNILKRKGKNNDDKRKNKWENQHDKFLND